MSIHLCRSRFRSCSRRFLVLPSFTPKTMRSLSRLSCKQSQKLHVFRRFFSAATYVSVVQVLRPCVELISFKSFIRLPQDVAIHLTDDNRDRVRVGRVASVVDL